MSDTITEDKIPTVRLGNLIYRLPFADLIRPLTPREAAGLRESITRRRKVLTRVVTYDSAKWGDRCVIDGANRLRIASDLGLDVPVQHRGDMSDEDARVECIDLNTDRRHLSPQEQRDRRSERLKRVLEMSTAGASLRDIASAEGVSLVQTHRDLNGDTSVPPGTLRFLSVFRRSLGTIPALLAGPLAGDLRRVAERHGVPFDGDRWPAYETLAVVIRDLADEAGRGE